MIKQNSTINEKENGARQIRIPKINFGISELQILLLEKQCFGNQITEEIDKLNRGINRNRISNAAESMKRHGRINERHNRNLKFISLVDNRRFTLSINNNDAIRRLGGTKTKPLVTRAKLLRVVTVSEESTSAPERIGRRTIAVNFFGHELEDFVEERVGVDEHEASVLASEGRDEVEGTTHAD